MPDPRFYDDLGPKALEDIAELADAALSDLGAAKTPIRLAAPLIRAAKGAVSYYADRRYLDDLKATKASACFLKAGDAELAPPGCVPLVTAEPQLAYARAAAALHSAKMLASVGIDPTASLEPDVVVGPGAVIGAGVSIGRGSTIAANAVMGPGVAIGRDCRIGPGAVIGFALIGDRVRILAGAVIGEAGFGVAASRAGAVDLPQLGRVILQDGVTVGANTCIDRGAWDDTVIGENTKIDNQVQIGHNVRLGRSCVLCGHVGVSGSTVVGDGVMFGAKAGIADHLTIGDGAQIMAASGVMHDIPAGEIWGGAPAVRARQFWRQVTWLSRAAGGKGERGGS
jgi:UDP-3-O-[3-hydroxymyristoyl] glucosamine N-acyltransferase